MFAQDVFKEVLSTELTKDENGSFDTELLIRNKMIGDIIRNRLFQEDTTIENSAKILKILKNQWEEEWDKSNNILSKTAYPKTFILDFMIGLKEYDKGNFIECVLDEYDQLSLKRNK